MSSGLAPNGALPQPDGPFCDRAPLEAVVMGARPHAPESLRAATLPNLTWQVKVAALKDSSSHYALRSGTSLRRRPARRQDGR